MQNRSGNITTVILVKINKTKLTKLIEKELTITNHGENVNRKNLKKTNRIIYIVII